MERKYVGAAKRYMQMPKWNTGSLSVSVSFESVLAFSQESAREWLDASLRQRSTDRPNGDYRLSTSTSPPTKKLKKC